MPWVNATILAGGELNFPADTPSKRIDVNGEFSFVGALEVFGGTSSFSGSGVALSRSWILTAGHNVDLDGDGLVDSGWSGNFHLPGLGAFGVVETIIHPSFTGFANPSIHDDLALLRLAEPLPAAVAFPRIHSSVDPGDVVTLVGFGRSGYGSSGYTTDASLADRRYGSNVIDSLTLDDEGSGLAELFRYDFDNPMTTGQPDGSLGNDLETIIGPGDSGGAALRWNGEEWVLVGINTFTEGFGGRFGDIGGGVLVEPYTDWIHSTTGIPEPMTGLYLTLFLAFATLRRGRI